MFFYFKITKLVILNTLKNFIKIKILEKNLWEIFKAK